jgi:hypothetical protein
MGVDGLTGSAWLDLIGEPLFTIRSFEGPLSPKGCVFVDFPFDAADVVIPLLGWCTGSDWGLFLGDAGESGAATSMSRRILSATRGAMGERFVKNGQGFMTNQAAVSKTKIINPKKKALPTPSYHPGDQLRSLPPCPSGDLLGLPTGSWDSVSILLSARKIELNPPPPFFDERKPSSAPDVRDS